MVLFNLPLAKASILIKKVVAVFIHQIKLDTFSKYYFKATTLIFKKKIWSVTLNVLQKKK